MPKITCLVCGTPVDSSEISQYSAFGGLPSPCCKLCFECNDYSIDDMGQLSSKSLKKRADIRLKEIETYQKEIVQQINLYYKDKL